MRHLRSMLVTATAALAAFAVPTALAHAPTSTLVEAGAIDPSSTTEIHCVGNVVGVDAGIFDVEESCFHDAAGADRLVELLTVESTNSSSSSTIGWHFTDTGFSGSNIRIVGTTCSGGVWAASGFWNNNIESTIHYCGSAPTRHWDYSYCGGTNYSIWGSASSLGYMNNRTSCIQYG